MCFRHILSLKLSVRLSKLCGYTKYNESLLCQLQMLFERLYDAREMENPA